MKGDKLCEGANFDRILEIVYDQDHLNFWFMVGSW